MISTPSMKNIILPINLSLILIDLFTLLPLLRFLQTPVIIMNIKNTFWTDFILSLNFAYSLFCGSKAITLVVFMPSNVPIGKSVYFRWITYSGGVQVLELDILTVANVPDWFFVIRYISQSSFNPP